MLSQRHHLTGHFTPIPCTSSHLLRVAAEGGDLVVGHPHVVLDDATVAGAGAEDVPLPGERAHARRVPGHRADLRLRFGFLFFQKKLDRVPVNVATPHHVTLAKGYRRCVYHLSCHFLGGEAAAPCQRREPYTFSTNDQPRNVAGLAAENSAKMSVAPPQRQRCSTHRLFLTAVYVQGFAKRGDRQDKKRQPVQALDKVQAREKPTSVFIASKHSVYQYCLVFVVGDAKEISIIPVSVYGGDAQIVGQPQRISLLAVHPPPQLETENRFRSLQEPAHLSELGRVPQLHGAVVGAHAQKVTPIPTHPLHAALLPPHGPIFDASSNTRDGHTHTAQTRGARKRGDGNGQSAITVPLFVSRRNTKPQASVENAAEASRTRRRFRNVFGCFRGDFASSASFSHDAVNRLQREALLQGKAGGRWLQWGLKKHGGRSVKAPRSLEVDGSI